MLMKAYVARGQRNSSRCRGRGISRPDDIRVGDIVEVVFDGPVAESYPLQGRALRVKVVE